MEVIGEGNQEGRFVMSIEKNMILVVVGKGELLSWSGRKRKRSTGKAGSKRTVLPLRAWRQAYQGRTSSIARTHLSKFSVYLMKTYLHANRTNCL